MASNKYACVDAFINWIDKLEDKLDKFFLSLAGHTQMYVDKACISMSNKVSQTVNDHRNIIINVLHGMYITLTSRVALLAPIAEANPTDLGSVISTVKNIVGTFIAPYTNAVADLLIIPQKVILVADKMQELISYVPPTQVGIKFDKFKLNIQPITFSEVVSGTTTPLELFTIWDNIDSNILTINVTPDIATIEMSVLTLPSGVTGSPSDFKQTNNSILVPKGSIVQYSINAVGYKPVVSSWQAAIDETLAIELTPV
jgi:hypothetical protein